MSIIRLHTRMQKFPIRCSIFSSFYFFFHCECCHNFSSSVLLSLSLRWALFLVANVWVRIKFYSVDTWFICNDEYSAIRDALSLPVLSPFIYMLQQASRWQQKKIENDKVFVPCILSDDTICMHNFSDSFLFSNKRGCERKKNDGFKNLSRLTGCNLHKNEIRTTNAGCQPIEMFYFNSKILAAVAIQISSKWSLFICYDFDAIIWL